jgi:hypothetical protein
VSETLDPKHIDRRTYERYLRSGLLDEKAFERHLKSLPDVADKAESIDTFMADEPEDFVDEADEQA